jgi:hypothetical protein
MPKVEPLPKDVVRTTDSPPQFASQNVHKSTRTTTLVRANAARKSVSLNLRITFAKVNGSRSWQVSTGYVLGVWRFRSVLQGSRQLVNRWLIALGRAVGNRSTPELLPPGACLASR